MSTVGAYEAKTQLPRLLAEVAKGEVVTITRHGRPVARLVPASGGSGGAASLREEFRKARAGVRLDGDAIADLVAEGRR
jgi:prevent-host-death family protein